MTASYIHERGDGVKVEYRRRHSPIGILDIEHRELRADGRPHNGFWYRVSDAHMLSLQRTGTDILDLMGPL